MAGQPHSGDNAGMDSNAPLLETVEHETAPSPTWTVLWLHGLGADGHDFAPIVPELVRRDWPAIRFVFPHAPVRAVTINNGMRMRAWYDIVSFDFDALAAGKRADEAGVTESVAQVEALIAREAARGIAPERIVLIGFSQGGAIALASALGREQPLAGIAGLSTYLPLGPHQAATKLKPAALSQPVFMAHGQFDPVVPAVVGQMGAATMKDLGFALEWHDYPMAHQVCAEEIQALGDWLDERFAG
jgi:phospholipase/carboxylesterase